MALLNELIIAYAKTDLEQLFVDPKLNISSINRAFHPHLKIATLAQWLLESARGTSELAVEHLNFGGLKYRNEMEGFATKVEYAAHDGKDFYCKFASIDAFILGFWKFLTRSPYKGWEQETKTPEGFVGFIGPIYAGDSKYVNKVTNLFPEARRSLDAALLGLSGTVPSPSAIEITKAPEVVEVRERFVIEGKTSLENVGKPITLQIDNRFATSGSEVGSNGSWKVDFVLLNSGSRKFKVSIGNESVTLVIRAGTSPGIIPAPDSSSKPESREIRLGGSVGLGGSNHREDVLAVKARLTELGFTLFQSGHKVDTGLIHAIKLFQSIIASSTALVGDGRVDVNGSTHKFLQASNAPHWMLMPLDGQGFTNFERKDKNDHHDFGCSWLADVIISTGMIYETNHRRNSPKISLITINDVSLPKGGDTPDHSGHECGNACDVYLPRKDGDFGTDIFQSNYDREAARAMLEALRKHKLVSRIFFNDDLLIAAGLCEFMPQHHHHVHFEVKAPTPVF